MCLRRVSHVSTTDGAVQLLLSMQISNRRSKFCKLPNEAVGGSVAFIELDAQNSQFGDFPVQSLWLLHNRHRQPQSDPKILFPTAFF